MRIFPLTAHVSKSSDKSFVVIEALILVPVMGALVSYVCSRANLGTFVSVAAGTAVAMPLIAQYGNYLNRSVLGRRNPDGVSSTAGDNGDRHVLEAMSGPADKSAAAERGTFPRQDL